MNGESKNETMKFREKAAFGLANLGNIPVMTLVSSYLLIFYTDVAGINPAAVATLFVIARVLDGVNDPIMGFIIDHLPKSRMGRFRPYLILGAIVCSINYILLWFGPVLFSGIKLVVVYVSYLLIGITFDLMDIPLNSMIPVMTDDTKERSSLSTIKGACYMMGALVLGIAAPIVLQIFGSNVLGYAVLVGGATAIILVFSIVGALGVKERVAPVEEEKYKFRDLLPMLSQRPVIVTFVSMLFVGAGMAVSGSMNVYYCVYVLDNNIAALSTYSMCSMVGMFVGMFASGKLTMKFGKRIVYSVGMFISFAGMLIRFVDISSLIFFYIAAVFCGIGSGLTMALGYGIQADNVDYVEDTQGKRAEGALASMNSFLVKAGQGIGGAIPGYVLALVGYVANQQQTPQALQGIIVLTVAVPAIFSAAGGLVFFFGYNINAKRLREITENLRAKRERR